MFAFVFRLVTAAIAMALCVSAFNNTVYIISNAETPLGLPGLTPVGLKRAKKCLPPIFGALDIGLIVSCPFDPDSGLCSETISTATPIADSLGLTIDTSCGADEETNDDCVPHLLKKFSKNSTQSMLVVWDLEGMDDLFENLDIDDDDSDDEEDDEDDDNEDDATPHFDMLTTIVKKKVESSTSQNCSGIDGQAPGSVNRRRALRRELKPKKRHFSSRILSRRHF